MYFRQEIGSELRTDSKGVVRQHKGVDGDKGTEDWRKMFFALKEENIYFFFYVILN